MNDAITYIFRKRLPQYNSIEELFNSIKNEISKTHQTHEVQLKYSGASPFIILKNLFSVKKNRKTIYHITGDVHYMSILAGRKSVLTIHDIQSANNGHFLKRLYIKLFWFWLPALMTKRITVISDFTKTELECIIPFAKDKIRVVHNPVNSKLISKSSVFNFKRPHILLMGTKPNKNLERSLEALKNFPCELTIVGILSIDQKNMLQELNIHYKNKSNLSFDDIIKCYEECDLLCFPSTYEGFGMPIIEAQALGKPVLTSNLGAMFEISQDSTCLVNPFDIEDIRKGIEKICFNTDYRQNLVEKGFENIKRFQVDHIARKYIEVYNEVLNN